MSRFALLSDKSLTGTPRAEVEVPAIIPPAVPPSRVGRKAISGYFSPEMSLAMHTCARRHGLSLQDLMAEAFNDVLRKYGESPIGS